MKMNSRVFTFVMRSEKSYTKSENLFLRKSNFNCRKCISCQNICASRNHLRQWSDECPICGWLRDTFVFEQLKLKIGLCCEPQNPTNVRQVIPCLQYCYSLPVRGTTMHFLPYYQRSLHKISQLSVVHYGVQKKRKIRILPFWTIFISVPEKHKLLSQRT